MVFLLIWISFLIILIGWRIDIRFNELRFNELIEAIQEESKKKSKEECFKCAQDILGV